MSNFLKILNIHTKSKEINTDLIQNAQDILEKLIEVDDFKFVELHTFEVEFDKNAHENPKFVCKILLEGKDKLVFEEEKRGDNFLGSVRAATNLALDFLQKENKRRSLH